MNLLERTIAWVSPETAARRIAFRRALDIQLRKYDAAKRDPKTASWNAGNGSANTEVGESEEIVRQRTRDLVRNNGYAAQIVSTISDHVVGTGIMGAPIGLKGRNLIKVNDDWQAWLNQCDHDQDSDFHGLMWLACNGMLESGAAIIRLRRQTFGRDAKVAPLRLQLLEPDFLDLSKYGRAEGSNYIDRGIEYDQDGRKVAYWLYDHHPGDVAQYRRRNYLSQRVPASEVIYLYQKLRPGQDRGMSVLAPAVMTLRDLQGYFEAELTRKRIESCLAGFITTEEPDGVALSERSDDDDVKYGVQTERFRPGMLTRLRPGEDIKIATPANSQGVGEFAQAMLREAASAAGVMYEHATGDFSNVNYSSWRAGHHGFRRHMERLQWHVMIHRACRPIGAAYQEAALAAQMLPVSGFQWRWTPPGFISVDPYKDAQADLANLRMGKTTLSQLVEERGYDYAEHLTQYAADLAASDEALGGAMFDGDPRKQARAATANETETRPAAA